MYQLPFKTRIQQTESKGLGVFAVNHIKQREIIERCPVLVINQSDITSLYTHYDVLKNYTFHWPPNNIAIAWGHGSLYNHSNHANASAIYYQESQFNYIIIECLQDIAPGEEICISYGDKQYFAQRNYQIIDERKNGN